MFLYGGSAKHAGITKDVRVHVNPALYVQHRKKIHLRTRRGDGVCKYFVSRQRVQRSCLLCEHGEELDAVETCDNCYAKAPEEIKEVRSVLAHLERLEAQMNRSNRNSKEPTVREKESSLRTKIRELRQQRDKLRVEVKQRRARVKGSSAKKDPSKTVISEQEVLEEQWNNVKAILQAYRFTGLSGKLTSHGVCVYISTAFEGHLLDSYFVDLVIAKPLRIHHHSIPVFIPLEKIATAHLQTDVQRFLFSLWEYLNAYVGRKYQADQLESDFCAFLTGPLQRNTLYNLLSFTYKVEQGRQTFSFSARLLYEDLTAALPTDVTVTRPGVEASSPHWEEHRASHEMFFRTKPLHRVFASFSKETEKLDLSLV